MGITPAIRPDHRDVDPVGRDLDRVLPADGASGVIAVARRGGRIPYRRDRNDANRDARSKTHASLAAQAIGDTKIARTKTVTRHKSYLPGRTFVRSGKDGFS